MTPDALATLLARLPRTKLATTPTPLQDLPRFSKELGGPRILVKRDDLTGLGFGGNKIRQLEFFIGDAIAAESDVLIAGGSFSQSNHARASAAAARAAGLAAVIVVRPGGAHPELTGNALLTRLLASDVRVVQDLSETPRDDRLAEVTARRASFEAIAKEYRERGHRPYLLLGTSVPLGVMGYVVASMELRQQFDELKIEPDWICVTSMGVTQAGLVLGRELLGESYSVTGLAYQSTGGMGARWVSELAQGAAGLLGLPLVIDADAVVNDDREGGREYGVMTEAAREAFDMLLRTEGLFVDPVYGAKGLAGMIRLIREGRIRHDETVVFVHTGGLPAIFAYGSELAGSG